MRSKYRGVVFAAIAALSLAILFYVTSASHYAQCRSDFATPYRPLDSDMASFCRAAISWHYASVALAAVAALLLGFGFLVLKTPRK